MTKKKIILLIGISFIFNVLYAQNWSAIKDTVAPVIEIPSEFDSAYRQPLANLGWEDAIHISPDGLHLYCTYLPLDFFSFFINGGLPNNFSSDYLRGAPTFGMDLTTNPLGASEWLHSDILYANKASSTDSFYQWTLSNMARAFYSEGAPTPTFSNDSTIELMAFTSNDNTTYNSDIWIINNTSANPFGVGDSLPPPVNSQYKEDNPHIVRIDTNNLVLFFDSDDLPGGNGDIDIWYATSNDNASTWTIPSNVNTINTSSQEHQPFLHQDNESGLWYLYYSAFHTDGKLGIFRTEQDSINNWNSWKAPEVVISAGNSEGIGEPTLTSNGDISFVLIYKDPNLTSVFDRYDADPWFLTRKVPITAINEEILNPKRSLHLFPNPIKGFIEIEFNLSNPQNLYVYDMLGNQVLYKRLDLNSNHLNLEVRNIEPGQYILQIVGENDIISSKFIKE